MKLARCLYFSAAKPALPFWQITSEIVGASQARNARDELTGVLLAHNGWFVQVLEGLPSRLTRLLLHIGSDPRHRDMQLVEFVTADARRFGDWSMAHATLTPAIAPQVGSAFDPNAFSAAELHALLGRATLAADLELARRTA